MTAVNDAIASDLATMARVVPVPIGDLGYGRDLSCVTDVTDDLREIDPNSPLGIAESSARRLGTPRGSLIEDPDYGLDLRGYANRATPQRRLTELAGQIRDELRKDDRVTDATVTVSFAPRTETLLVEAMLSPADPAVDTFSLVLSVSSGGVLVEAVS